MDRLCIFVLGGTQPRIKGTDEGRDSVLLYMRYRVEGSASKVCLTVFDRVY